MDTQDIESLQKKNSELVLLLQSVNSIAFKLASALVAVPVVTNTAARNKHDMIRREPVMDLVMDWRKQWDASMQGVDLRNNFSDAINQERTTGSPHDICREIEKNLKTRIQYLESLVDAYGAKSFQYDIEHPMDGLNGANPEEKQLKENK